MVKRFLGASIAVKAENCDEALKRFSAVFGIEPKPIPEELFPFPGVKHYYFDLGNAYIFLVSGEAGTSVAKFCERRGEGVFLLSCQVDDVAQHMKNAVAHGVRFSPEEPVPVGDGFVAFAHPKSMYGVQFEFPTGEGRLP